MSECRPGCQCGGPESRRTSLSARMAHARAEALRRNPFAKPLPGNRAERRAAARAARRSGR